MLASYLSCFQNVRLLHFGATLFIGVLSGYLSNGVGVQSKLKLLTLHSLLRFSCFTPQFAYLSICLLQITIIIISRPLAGYS
jgi:hypothetical protein